MTFYVHIGEILSEKSAQNFTLSQFLHSVCHTVTPKAIAIP